MCGIFCQYPGISSNGYPKESLVKSLGALSHRGPDASHYYYKEGTFLGHNRLSIVDLDERSNQPFFYKNFVIVFNGEIFNFKEIREKLEKRGISFSTNSDTEVLLKAYIEYGTDVYSLLNGFWAFIIYDIDENRLHVSRDRFGQKPLFFKKNEWGFVFSSEVAPIFDLDKTGPNLNAIAGFLYSSYEYSLDTFFEDIFFIEPACHYVFSKGILLEKFRYWQYPTKNDLIYDQSIFNELLHDAVNIRKSTDVRFALAGSGGLDSSLIQSILSDNLKVDHVDFTVYSYGDSNKDYNEVSRSRTISKSLGNSFVPVTIDDYSYIEFRNRLVEIVRNAGMGFASPAIISYDALLRKVNQDDCKVLIDGQGADEILGGYELLNYSTFISFFLKKMEFLYAGVLALKLLQSPGTYFLKILNLFRFSLPYFVFKIINPNSKFFKSNYILRPSFDKNSIIHDDSINRFLIFQHKCILHQLLYYSDIISMKNSIESRSPFMDHRLVDYLLRTGSKSKFSLSMGFKAALKESSYFGLVKDLVDTRKLGFNTTFNVDIKMAILKEIKNSEVINLDIFRKVQICNFIDSCLLKIDQNVDFDFRFIFRIYQVHLFLEIFLNKKTYEVKKMVD
jgi:asparagine synthase (glutamine-hydrolysing)